MMPQFTKQDGRLQEERGAVFLLLAIVFLTGITMVGVAIDSGNLYHASMLLQKTIDAASLAGAKRIAVTGKQEQLDNWPQFEKQIQLIARSMIITNMRVRKKDNEFGDNRSGDALRYTVVVDRYQDTVEIDATWTVPLYLLRFLPGFSTHSSVRMHSKSQVQRSMVSLMLDTSGSMMCPADGSDCSCSPLCSGIRKVDRLKEAVALFSAQFNDRRDLLHLGFFSLGAIDALIMQPAGGFSLGQVDDALKNMFLQGATNQCDALLNSYLAVRPAIAAQGQRKNVAYVLFSDGAPTAARFSFAHPTQLPPNNYTGLPAATHDYYNWAVDYRDPNDPAPLDQKPTLPLKPGAMVLAKAGLVPFDWDLGNAPTPANKGPGDSTVNCSVKDPVNPSAPFVSCMSDFGFHVPWDNTGKVWGAEVQFPDYRKQYYNCVIASSDGLRNDGGVVYTVGLGAPAPGSSDPYQNALNDSARKDYFFSRIANDPEYRTLPQFEGDFAKYLPPTRASHLSQGKYLSITNAMALDEIFLRLYDVIVRKVKTVQLVK